MHVDGYTGYNGLPGITLVGCWAHARRKFTEALAALPKEKQNADVAARHGLEFCNRLFALERELKNVSDETRYLERLKRGQPIIDEFKAWLDYQKPRVLPKSAFGQAVSYCLNQWDKLLTYLLTAAWSSIITGPNAQSSLLLSGEKGGCSRTSPVE